MNLTFRTSLASRERNRVHAQRTRQRKKEQMQGLQGRVSTLKEQQLRLRQIINEKNTANILIRLFAQSGTAELADTNEDPRVEELLRRDVEDIPDSSKIPDLPALILPGQHASKTRRPIDLDSSDQDIMGLDGIDYDLLGRDRSQCTTQELDKIRRERNRMHAKRTRDRKRIFTEKLSEMARLLQMENDMLKDYLLKIDPTNTLECMAECGSTVVTNESPSTCSTLVEESPTFMSECLGEQEMSDISLCSSFVHPSIMSHERSIESCQKSQAPIPSCSNSISILLKVAGCFEKDAFKRPLSEISTLIEPLEREVREAVRKRPFTLQEMS
jgi:Basic region leucine zipper